MSKPTTQTKQNRAKLSSVFSDPKPEAKEAEQSTERPERAGQASMPFWVPIAAKRQLRVMAAENDTTQQAMMRDALNMLFTKYGKPPIA